MIQIKSKKIPLETLQNTLTGAFGEAFDKGQGVISFDEKAVLIGEKKYALPVRLETLYQALLSCGMIQHQTTFRLGDICFNAPTRLLSRGEKKVSLTERESALMAYFLAHPDTEVKKSDLLTQVWGWHESVQTHTIESHICTLRTKCAFCGEIITSEQGYRFCPCHHKQ